MSKKQQTNFWPADFLLSGDRSHAQYIFLSLLVLAFFLAPSCARRDPEAERRTAISETFAKLRSCLPEGQPDVVEENVKLAIASVTRTPNETSVRLVGYALNEAIDFDLPIYSLSRGRWVIKEKGRAYLLNEECREYRLQDRKSSSGQKVSQDGRIKLDQGQAFEVTLIFPRLPDQTQMGVLVYGGRVLPFTLLDETRNRISAGSGN